MPEHDHERIFVRWTHRLRQCWWQIRRRRPTPAEMEAAIERAMDEIEAEEEDEDEEPIAAQR